MAKYKIDTGLARTTNYSDFSTDKEAWETLSKILPDRFGILFKEVENPIKIVNEKKYTELYFEKYGESDSEKLFSQKYWLPICRGITGEQFDL